MYPHLTRLSMWKTDGSCQKAMSCEELKDFLELNMKPVKDQTARLMKTSFGVLRLTVGPKAKLRQAMF